MRIAHILLLCILGAALISAVLCHSGKGPDDCCFVFYPRRVKKDLIRSYYMTDYRCAKTGVVLITNKNINICVDPNLPWVEKIMRTLDEKNF